MAFVKNINLYTFIVIIVIINVDISDANGT